MGKKDMVYLAGTALIAVLLAANLLKPTAPLAAAPDERVPVAISAAGDSAWAVVGNRVYYVSLRARNDFPSDNRTIKVIDAKNLE